MWFDSETVSLKTAPSVAGPVRVSPAVTFVMPLPAMGIKLERTTAI